MNRGLLYKTRKAAEQILSLLPEFWQEYWRPHILRVSEEISWIFKLNGTVVDLGGSSGFHCMICSKLGMKAICIDNFKVRPKGHICDFWFEHDLECEKIASRLGVEFMHVDMLEWNPSFAENSIDVVMTFDVIEHLYRSPKSIYSKMVVALRHDGHFLIGGPNAANLLKRIRVPLGKNIFARLDEWWAHDYFIGHVREPIVADLRFIAKDLGLDILHVFGRNWLGMENNSLVIRTAAIVGDKFLRKVPSLCSNIYLLAKKKE